MAQLVGVVTAAKVPVGVGEVKGRIDGIIVVVVVVGDEEGR